MTDEEIIEAMARASVKASLVEADAHLAEHHIQMLVDDHWQDHANEARAAFAVVKPAIQEQCAQIADDHVKKYAVGVMEAQQRFAAREIAAAIRNPERTR